MELFFMELQPDFPPKKHQGFGVDLFLFWKTSCIYIYIHTKYIQRERNIHIYIYLQLFNLHSCPTFKLSGVAPWSGKNALASYSLNGSWVQWLYILLVYEDICLYIYIYMHGTFEKRSKPFWHSILPVVWYGAFFHALNNSPKMKYWKNRIKTKHWVQRCTPCVKRHVLALGPWATFGPV